MSSTRSAASCLCKGCVSVFHRTEKDQSCSAKWQFSSGAGLIFAALRKAMPKNEKLCCFLGGLAAPVLNTVFFMGFLVLIFYNCEYVQNLANTLGAANAFMFIVLLVGVQAIFEWAICCVVAGAVSLPVRKYLKMN